jgi:hypothetical protein
MKKLVKFLALFAFVCGWMSCDDDNKNDNRVYFYDEPGFIESMDNDTVIKTTHGKFLVHSLDKSLKVGNLLWTAFEVDLNSKKQEVDSVSLYTAIAFRYSFVDSTQVILPVDTVAFEEKLSDDYTENIPLAVLYKDYVDNLLFFGFQNESSGDTGYVYELFLNPEKEKDSRYPTLYIRAKKKDIVPATRADKQTTVFAFEMSDFIKYYRDNISKDGSIIFNLKYKTETKDGKDVYRAFQSNPIHWK